MRWLRAGVLAALVAAVVALSGAPVPADEPVTPAVHRRGAEQTYLTFPEWFLVHSPAEYADYVRLHPPSGFPWFGHIGQFWRSYAAVSEATAGEGLNVGYHVMILVIGTSTTIEYTLKALYEKVIGRVTEHLMPDGGTEEDRYGARIAQDYVNFIRIRPWYEYDFLGKLAGLWRQTSLWGPGPIRKWERKYALSTEYLVKGVYGWLIGLGTAVSYDAPRVDTAVVVEHLPANTADLHIIEVVSTQPDGLSIVTVPRYASFGIAAVALARVGVDFVEIAGNRGDIVMSVIAPREWTDLPPGTRVLFEQPILTHPGEKRSVLVVRVADLAAALRSCSARIEHLYDY